MCVDRINPLKLKKSTLLFAILFYPSQKSVHSLLLDEDDSSPGTAVDELSNALNK